MKTLKCLATVFALALFMPGLALALDDMPAGVGTRLTIYGNVFTYNGMTLYASWVDDIPGKSKCTDKKLDVDSFRKKVGTNQFLYIADNPYGHRTCVEKWPPLKVQEGAKPVGEWSIFERADKTRQWAYQGHPVHLYHEDKRPGQVNGDCPGDVKCSNQGHQFGEALTAPFDAPGGIRLVTMDAGVVLAAASGAVLYTRDGDRKDKSLCTKACLDFWHPVIAAAGAKPYGDWSLVETGSADGSRQWAHYGKPLYTAGDMRKIAVRGTGADRGRLALIYEMPKAPAGVSVAMGPTEAPILVDDQGLTLYFMSCIHSIDNRLSCDRQGDAPQYYQGLCGGPERCAETFKFLTAPEGAVENEVWTVRTIDTSNPARILAADDKGTRVWFWNGRPVFRYYEDTEPGDFHGMGIRYGAGTGNLNVILAYVGYETAFE